MRSFPPHLSEQIFMICIFEQRFGISKFIREQFWYKLLPHELVTPTIKISLFVQKKKLEHVNEVSPHIWV